MRSFDGSKVSCPNYVVERSSPRIAAQEAQAAAPSSPTNSPGCIEHWVSPERGGTNSPQFLDDVDHDQAEINADIEGLLGQNFCENEEEGEAQDAAAAAQDGGARLPSNTDHIFTGTFVLPNAVNGARVRRCTLPSPCPHPHPAHPLPSPCPHPALTLPSCRIHFNKRGESEQALSCKHPIVMSYSVATGNLTVHFRAYGMPGHEHDDVAGGQFAADAQRSQKMSAAVPARVRSHP